MKDEITPFDLFAAAALQGILAQSYNEKCLKGTGAGSYVEEAEHLAKAMVAARNSARKFRWERIKAESGPDAHAGGRDQDRWSLVAPSGLRAATVWDNGTWHTWDEQGVGMENSTSSAGIGQVKWIAYCSVLGQGAHGYGPLVTRAA